MNMVILGFIMSIVHRSYHDKTAEFSESQKHANTWSCYTYKMQGRGNHFSFGVCFIEKFSYSMVHLETLGKEIV